MSKRNISKDFYFYTKGKYIREKINNRRGCIGYRIIPVRGDKEGRKLLICIRKKEGPRGGKTKVISLLRRFDVDLRTISSRKVRNAIKKFREFYFNNK